MDVSDLVGVRRHIHANHPRHRAGCRSRTSGIEVQTEVDRHDSSMASTRARGFARTSINRTRPTGEASDDHDGGSAPRHRRASAQRIGPQPRPRSLIKRSSSRTTLEAVRRESRGCDLYVGSRGDPAPHPGRCLAAQVGRRRSTHRMMCSRRNNARHAVRNHGSNQHGLEPL